MSQGQPAARYRPRGEAYLQVYRGSDRIEVSLDGEVTDLPPQLDPRLAKPPVLARVHRVAAGHRLAPGPGASVKVNGCPVGKDHVLRGGDEIEIDRFFAVYTTAREELPWPMTLVVWPPEGPALEIRSHRARLEIGYSRGDVLIDDPAIDGLHCVVKRFRTGLMQIDDFGSYNGVYVDGRKVVESASLRDGAEIRLGNTRLKAWSEAPDVADLREMPIQDAYDGLPESGYDPDDQEPLRPYTVELGPEYVQKRRRTFSDEVPTRVEPAGERVSVRRRLRPEGHEGYNERPVSPDGEDHKLPDWAPVPAQEAREKEGERKKGRWQELETGVDWELRDKGGLTLIHRIDRPIKPRRGT